ncbi:MAG: cold shock domain-containing protein [Magnetococcales bacterium]|nr:cold shock domain-containing protein [Magnetococcales bacterium]NGZ07561.1 cold shock domain-containing protein [Magnetococcales bacterium]
MSPARESSLEAVVRTFLCAKIHNADQYKDGRPASEWAELYGGFYAAVIQHAAKGNGKFVKCLANGVMCTFRHPADAVQAAIDLQEWLQERRRHPGHGLSCGVGIATGEAYAFQIEGKRIDYLGVACDVARLLCEQARGHAILLHHPDSAMGVDFTIRSRAGESAHRPFGDYFQEMPPLRISGLAIPVRRMAIHWQATPGEYIAASPIEPVRGQNEEETSPAKTYFGKVSAFKKERGFGFIQYYSDNHEYQEIYFHMTYVVHQVPVFENDHVQFVIKPGKEGRPQACAVLVLGSRMQGRVESCLEDGSGFVTIRDQDAKILRFFFLPQEVQYQGVRVDDLVEFTAGSGSESEGLTALQVVRQEEINNVGQTSDVAEQLVIGAIEHAVVTVYFPEKGYGFAKCKRNSVYIHVSELADPEHVPGPGDHIEFEVYPGRNETYRANNVRLIKKKGLDL